MTLTLRPRSSRVAASGLDPGHAPRPVFCHRAERDVMLGMIETKDVRRDRGGVPLLLFWEIVQDRGVVIDSTRDFRDASAVNQ